MGQYILPMDAFIEFLLDLVSTFGVVGVVAAPFVLGWWWVNWQVFFSEPASDERRKRLAHDLRRRRKWIRVRTFQNIYFLLLKGLLDGVARHLTHDKENVEGPPNVDTWPVRLFGLNPFTEGGYLLCLQLALIYPLLGLFIVWLLGGEGTLASATLFPAVESEWQRVVAVGLLGLSGFLFFKGFRSKGWQSLISFFGAFASTVIVAVAIGVAGAVAIAVVSAFTVAVAGAGVVAGAGAGAVTGAFAGGGAGGGSGGGAGGIAGAVVGAGAIAVAVAGVIAGVIAGVVVGAAVVVVVVVAAVAMAIVVALTHDRLYSKRSIALYWLGFNVFYVGTVLLILAWALPRADVPEILLVPVFLVLLPMANAVLDWSSLGVTRGLLYAISRGHHRGLVALGFAGLDILLALVFLFLIASLTILLLSLLNLATVAWGGQPLLNLQLLLDGLALEPGALEFGWIHFMMLSTLIPTLIHFFVAGFAVVLLLPECLRRWILLGWRKSEVVRMVAFGWISLAPLLALAGPALLLWGLYELLTAWGGTVGHHLLAWVHTIALAVDPSTTAPLP